MWLSSTIREDLQSGLGQDKGSITVHLQVIRAILMERKTDISNTEEDRVFHRQMIAMAMKDKIKGLHLKEAGLMENAPNIETETWEGMTHLKISEVDQVRVAEEEVVARITTLEEGGWRSVVQLSMMEQTSSQRKKSWQQWLLNSLLMNKRPHLQIYMKLHAKSWREQVFRNFFLCNKLSLSFLWMVRRLLLSKKNMLSYV